MKPRLRTLLLAPLLLACSLHVAVADTAPVTPTQCGPGPGGSPCDGSGPASQGNTSKNNQGAGNPINVITGNKYQQEVDLPALPGVLGLEIVRHYNSSYAGSTSPNGILGRGWRLSYETDLNAIGNTLQIIQADGTRIIFVRDPKHPSQCATNDPARGTVSIQKTPRGDEYLWTWTNGRTLSFNHQGKLTQIKVPTGEFVSLTRDLAGALVKVTDPQGRSLVLGYPANRDPARFNGVTHIDSPVGRFAYAYGSAVPTGYASGSVTPKGYTGNPRDLLANLVSVSFPNAVSRHYHYEDPAHPTLLTGISVGVTGPGVAGQGAKLQRINTWAYDTQGRGILSVKGLPRRLDNSGKPVPGTGIEQVNLDFSTPGKTVLTNSLGQVTIYKHAIVGNEYRLLEVRGAGCGSCGEANVRYGYDKLGRLIEETKLSPEGQPMVSTRTERDSQGRPIRISSVVYRNGKALPARQQVRYEYAGATSQPSLIAQPSVVPGKEHQISITYNTKGQVTQVTERGYSPLDEKGQAEVTPISRTTTYAYRSINGRSLLTQIDGPLANGKTNSPADSDITRLEWDRAGSAVVKMSPPGGLASTVQYDAVGRIAEVSNAENFRTTFTYDAGSRLVRVSSSAKNWQQVGIKPVVQSFHYDALGHMIETGTGALVNASDKTDRNEADEPYRPLTRQAYDVAGHLLWQAEALGILKRARYDIEGKILSSTVQTRSFEQTEQYRYDALNRLAQVSDSVGSVRNIVYGNKPNTQRPHGQSAFQILKDDFGRTVRVASASQGSIVKRYNNADQLIQQQNGTGDMQTYAYDLAGRRIRFTLVPKTGEAQTTTWRYAQNRLIEVVDPVQTERIRYNERGQPASRTITLKLNNGTEVTHVTRYIYTADGSLKSQSLPDGTQIIYARNGQGQVVAVSRQTSPWTIFGWGRQTLVKNLERDLIGLRSVTYGNGIQSQWQRSKQGVLARVVYTRPEGHVNDSSRIAAASQAAVKQSTLGSILGKLLPSAYAHTPPPSPSTLPGALGLPDDPQALFDARLLYDQAGSVLLQKQQGRGPQQTQAYAYDSDEQLIAAQSASPSPTIKTSSTSGSPSVWRYHYDSNGNRDLAQENVPVTEMGQTRKAVYNPTSNALLTPPGLGREYVWNAQGQLAAIRQENKELARYRYNHHGLRVSKQVGAHAEYTLYNDQRQRIADLDGEGKITRQYIWLADHLIATLDAQQLKALQAPTEGFWQELTQTAQALWNNVAGRADRLAFVHVNHLGAPIAATDAAGLILWQADYAPYGKLIKVSTAATRKAVYTLALRYAGQWEDAESGLYYNDFRYYDPQAGRYLSPDPLGRLAERLGSPNAYAYVNNNPLSYIDPWGLVLFAFDGTGNDESDPNTLSNVVNFRDLYQDGQPFYITGPGTLDPTTGIGPTSLDIGGIGDTATAYTGKARIDAMINKLNIYSDGANDNAAFNIDIVGFSRGAAEARDFANQINANFNNGYYQYKDTKGNVQCQKVNLNFMGLWDTVLSTHTGSYQLAIPDSFKYVAQAVALNEYRGGLVAFPLESIMSGTIPAGVTRIEQGFLGSHSDIGGGFPDGDLAKVALVWMVDQATSAGVSMSNPIRSIIANPVLHDKSSNLLTGQPTATSEDRNVHYLDGSTVKQRQANTFGMSYADTQQFISYKSSPNSIDNISGTVDMSSYLSWLNSNGYNINMTVQ